MPTPRVPQDHQKKAAPADDYFTFTQGGVDYTMPTKTLDVISTKFIRANRRRDNIDYAFTVIETLAGDGKEGAKILDAFDALTHDELETCVNALTEHLGATQGE